MASEQVDLVSRGAGGLEDNIPVRKPEVGMLDDLRDDFGFEFSIHVCRRGEDGRGERNAGHPYFRRDGVWAGSLEGLRVHNGVFPFMVIVQTRPNNLRILASLQGLTHNINNSEYFRFHPKLPLR